MGAQRGEILRAILRLRFDEFSARRILSERLSHRHLMRAQLGGFLRRDLGQRFDEASAWRIPTLATICSESHSEEQVLAIIAKRPRSR